MKKVLAVLAVGAALAGLGALARHFARMPHTDWAKRIESMPDNAPPKWIRNITAIRGNTDRILEPLEPGRAEPAPAAPPPPGG